MEFKWSSWCLWTKCSRISFRYKVLEIAADILIKEETLSGSDELSNQVVVHLLPFMVIDSDDMESAGMKIAIYLSKSGICSLHPVLRGWEEGKKLSCFLENMNRYHFKRKLSIFKNWLYLLFKIMFVTLYACKI